MEVPKTGGPLNVNDVSDSDKSGQLEVPEFTVPDQEKLKSGDTKYYFELMQQQQAESRAFETMVNILKARDEAAKQAIQNIGR